LFSFIKYQRYAQEIYESVPFIIDSQAPVFSKLLPGVVNPHYRINQSKANYYHAYCVMANNFTVLLWRRFFKVMRQQFNISQEHLTPYLKQTLDNISHFPDQALTGPIMRKYIIILEKNLSALMQEKDSYQDIYKALIEANLNNNGDEHEDY